HTRFSRDWSSDVCSSDLGSADAAQSQGPAGTRAAPATLGGLLVEILAEEGALIAAGTKVAIIEAMKMEHIITAEQSGIVRLVAEIGRASWRDRGWMTGAG